VIPRAARSGPEDYECGSYQHRVFATAAGWECDPSCGDTPTGALAARAVCVRRTGWLLPRLHQRSAGSGVGHGCYSLRCRR
jgi:hypothetical protein